MYVAAGGNVISWNIVNRKVSPGLAVKESFNADDERSVRQGKVRSPAASDLD